MVAMNQNAGRALIHRLRLFALPLDAYCRLPALAAASMTPNRENAGCDNHGETTSAYR
jgi:hypothetical protein